MSNIYIISADISSKKCAAIPIIGIVCKVRKPLFFSINDHKNDRECNPVIKSEIVPSLIGEIRGDKRNCFFLNNSM